MMIRSLSLAFQAMCRTTVDLLYPRQCRVCGETGRCGRFPFLCDDCFAGAKRLQPPWCEICALPFHGSLTGIARCPNCGDRKLHFDQARAAMHFRGPVRHAVHGLKYEHQLYWSQALCAWLLETPPPGWNLRGVDVIMPVPLHPVRERERGFNQAWLLARAFSKHWKIPVHRHGLVRARKTETQTHLDRDERRLNLHGAFRAPSPRIVSGKRVLLMDDVLTTGSTTSECARILREAGATSVLVFTLARG